MSKCFNIQIPEFLAKALAEVMKGREYPDEISEIYIIESIGEKDMVLAEAVYEDIIQKCQAIAENYEKETIYQT